MYDEVFSTLTVKNVQMSDAGVYRCEVANHQSQTGYREVAIYVHGNHTSLFTIIIWLPIKLTFIHTIHVSLLIVYYCVTTEKTFLYLDPLYKDVPKKVGAEYVDLSMGIYSYPQPEVTWYYQNGTKIPNKRKYHIK